jgi:uncharacterized protein YyaL (SSP411 family)
MSDGKGGYFSAIDADSENEEGKFYVWTLDEIKKIKLPPCGKADPFKVLTEYFCLNETGYWEKNRYVLFRRLTDEKITTENNITTEQLHEFIKIVKPVLYSLRQKRPHPVTDKKIITSWNALHLSALCNAYEAFENEDFRAEAITIAQRILENSSGKMGEIYHLSNSKGRKETGFLDDYAFTISALIDLYEVTFDEHWLNQAKLFTDFTINNFYDESDGFFWYTSNLGEKLIARKKEILDNVIPSSNSEMAIALFRLSAFFDSAHYRDISMRMILAVESKLTGYPTSFSNWLTLLMHFTKPLSEIAIAGEHADQLRKEIATYYLPDVLFCGCTESKCELPLLQNRFQTGKTLIYICQNKTCKLPVENTSMALAELGLP